jgi:hypothetical protein
MFYWFTDLLVYRFTGLQPAQPVKLFWLAGWLDAGWLAGWLGWLAGWQAGWQAGWLVGWAG